MRAPTGVMLSGSKTSFPLRFSACFGVHQGLNGRQANTHKAVLTRLTGLLPLKALTESTGCCDGGLVLACQFRRVPKWIAIRRLHRGLATCCHRGGVLPHSFDSG